MASASSRSPFPQSGLERFGRLMALPARPAVEFSMLVADPVFWGWGVEPGDRHPCILPPESAEKRRTGCVSSRHPGPSKAVGQQDATHPDTRSKTRTVDGAATHRRVGLKGKAGSQLRQR
jgi:hypothetical protein